MVPLVYLAQLSDLEHGCCPRECCSLGRRHLAYPGASMDSGDRSSAPHHLLYFFSNLNLKTCHTQAAIWPFNGNHDLDVVP